MVGRIVILFFVRHQRRPLSNDEKNSEDESSGEDVLLQQSKDGVHGVGEEENMKDGDLFEEASGDSITYEILIFFKILPSLF